MPRRPRESAKPPPAVLARPLFVSQHTAPLVLGFKSARAYLEWLPEVEARGFKVIPRGKDRLIALDDAIAVLVVGRNAEPAPTTRSADELDDADDVLRALGLRPRPALRVVGGDR